MNEYKPEEYKNDISTNKANKKNLSRLIVSINIVLCIILGIIIMYLMNGVEILIAKNYVKNNYNIKYNYVSSNAVYTSSGCTMPPKEKVNVFFQGEDRSVITIVVKNGKVISVE